MIQRGNATTFGLGSGVWTRDVSKAHTLARAIRAGTVWVNCYQAMDPAVPFGGYKMSGYGRECGPAARRGVPERQGGLDQDRLTSTVQAIQSLVCWAREGRAIFGASAGCGLGVPTPKKPTSRLGASKPSHLLTCGS